jgi:hypothetical protein
MGVGFFPALLDEAIQKAGLPLRFRPTQHFLSAEATIPLDRLDDDLPRR